MMHRDQEPCTNALYSCADTQARADEIVAMGVREPDGLLRRLEATVTA